MNLHYACKVSDRWVMGFPETQNPEFMSRANPENSKNSGKNHQNQKIRKKSPKSRKFGKIKTRNICSNLEIRKIRQIKNQEKTQKSENILIY